MTIQSSGSITNNIMDYTNLYIRGMNELKTYLEALNDEVYMDAHMHFDLYKNRQDVLDYIEENKSYTIAVTNLPDLYRRYYTKSGITSL